MLNKWLKSIVQRLLIQNISTQIALHDGNSTTFHFVHPEGRDMQIRERDSVKEMLVQLLPRFKRKVNKELEERHRMLSENPGLLQLYKDLVITQILTAEEFWAQHAPGVNQKNGVRPAAATASSSTASGPGPASSSKAQPGKQDVGVSGSFLADIKPQADGANGIKYNLTPDIITSIFKTYPAVKRKHFENVPTKMSEQEFWNKFFQSHYFHRDRIHGLAGVKDIFTECAKDDDNAIKAQLKAGVNDRLANVSGFSDRTLDESYGTGEETPSKPGKNANAANIVHQSIIKRFNQHSIMVMKSADKEQPQQPAESAAKVAPGAPSSSTSTASGSRTRLREKTDYEDLEAPPAKKQAPLNLAKVERYLNGPTPASGSTDYLNMSDVSASRDTLRQLLGDWEQSNCQSALSSACAVSALVDLSPGGSLMKTSRGDALVGQCPDAVRNDLRQLYGSLSELLRHFWACFPPTTPDLQQKADKMLETLNKFQAVKLKPFENELARNYSSLNSPLTVHLNQLLEAAFRKHATWKQKKLPSVKR